MELLQAWGLGLSAECLSMAAPKGRFSSKRAVVHSNACSTQAWLSNALNIAKKGKRVLPLSSCCSRPERSRISFNYQHVSYLKVEQFGMLVRWLPSWLRCCRQLFWFATRCTDTCYANSAAERSRFAQRCCCSGDDRRKKTSDPVTSTCFVKEHFMHKANSLKRTFTWYY